MGDSEKPDELSVRLHLLRAREGFTIQQMAKRCSVPKSSLESYMRAVDAKRPGVDALVSIADGMGVSIDWLVGRTENMHGKNLEDRDYALACFNVVLAMLEHMQNEQKKHPSRPVFENGKFGGLEIHEAAALAMSEFLGIIERYRQFSIYTSSRKEFFDSIAENYSSRSNSLTDGNRETD